MRKLFLLGIALLVFYCAPPTLPQKEKGYGILRLENNYKLSSYGFHILHVNIDSYSITLANGYSEEIALKEGEYPITGYLSIPLMENPLSINRSAFIISGLKSVESWP